MRHTAGWLDRLVLLPFTLPIFASCEVQVEPALCLLHSQEYGNEDTGQTPAVCWASLESATSWARWLGVLIIKGWQESTDKAYILHLLRNHCIVMEHEYMIAHVLFGTAYPMLMLHTLQPCSTSAVLGTVSHKTKAYPPQSLH